MNHIEPPVGWLACVLIIGIAPHVVWAHGWQSHGESNAALVKRITLAQQLSPVRLAHAAANTRIEDGMRIFESDGLPDHATGTFPNRRNPNTIREKRYLLRMPLQPMKAASPTPLGHSLFGVAINGVVFDPATAEFWNNDSASGWNEEALTGKTDLGLDRNNAHVQPDGAYHYHGLPVGLAERLDYRNKPALLGFAADGFPIYGPTGWRNTGQSGGATIELRSSYRLKSGLRPGGPGGTHDGTYGADFEFVPGLGDLDECNGRTGVSAEFPAGTYHYVVTTNFPFIPRCWTGTPDRSFMRKPPPGGFAKGAAGKGPPPGLGKPRPF